MLGVCKNITLVFSKLRAKEVSTRIRIFQIDGFSLSINITQIFLSSWVNYFKNYVFAIKTKKSYNIIYTYS